MAFEGGGFLAVVMSPSSKVLRHEGLVTFTGERGHREEAWPYGWSKVGCVRKEAVFFFPCSIIKSQKAAI